MSIRDRYQVTLTPRLTTDAWDWAVATWTIGPTVFGTAESIAAALSEVTAMIEHLEGTP
jgi:hypothetical protein